MFCLCGLRGYGFFHVLNYLFLRVVTVNYVKLKIFSLSANFSKVMWLLIFFGVGRVYSKAAFERFRE